MKTAQEGYSRRRLLSFVIFIRVKLLFLVTLDGTNFGNNNQNNQIKTNQQSEVQYFIWTVVRRYFENGRSEILRRSFKLEGIAARIFELYRQLRVTSLHWKSTVFKRKPIEFFFRSAKKTYCVSPVQASVTNHSTHWQSIVLEIGMFWTEKVCE